MVSAELPDHGGPMIAPAKVGDEVPPTTPPWFRQILVRKAPSPFDVDDLDAVAPTAGLRPGPTRLDAAGRRTSRDLAATRIGRRGRRLPRG